MRVSRRRSLPEASKARIPQERSRRSCASSIAGYTIAPVRLPPQDAGAEAAVAVEDQLGGGAARLHAELAEGGGEVAPGSFLLTGSASPPRRVAVELRRKPNDVFGRQMYKPRLSGSRWRARGGRAFGASTLSSLFPVAPSWGWRGFRLEVPSRAAGVSSRACNGLPARVLHRRARPHPARCIAR